MFINVVETRISLMHFLSFVTFIFLSSRMFFVGYIEWQ